ncbi:MAG: SLBB domain-containing protein [Spirochaetes bacterium]|nr:SLBB domain-containing protein [Spirochaetota bacterium]
MKRPALLFLLALAALPLALGQSLGFGANGAIGPTFLGGDPAAITQRILAATEYRLTPGDTYQVSITMNGLTPYTVILAENYDLDIPYIGTLNVKGMYFSDLRRMVVEKLRKVLPLADFVSFTLAAPARFDVSVFGGVEAPGIVTVTALSRVSDAIVAAKGSRRGASYRQIALIRDGRKIVVDFLRYTMDAVSEQNPTLEPGDKIYVPPQEIVVALTGQVRFPGSYELLAGETIQQLLAYAGGPLPDAQAGAVELISVVTGGTIQQRLLNLKSDAGMALANGDRVRVPSIVENGEMILVTGALFGAPVSAEKPVQIPLAPIAVNIPFTAGTTLLAVLESLGGPTPYAKAKESLILRKSTGERIPVDVDALWKTRNRARDVPLEPGDTVNIPIVIEVFVLGEVRSPGRVPFNPGFTVADYLLAAGGINPLTGDANGLYVLDKMNGRTKTARGGQVEPGALLFVDRNAWTKTQEVFANITVVATLVTTLVTAITGVISVVRSLP